MTRRKSQSITGVKYRQRKTMNMSARTRPYLSIVSLQCANRGGRKAKRILEPSSGGIGTMLNTASTKFMIIIEATIGITENGTRSNLAARPKNRAKTKLDNGPAIDTQASPHFPFFKL